jgi:GNAT superfamily N-acetyltransferase
VLNLRYQKATLEDLELLVTVRCRVLRAANLLPDDAPLPEVECQTRAYYRKAFAEDTHTAYLVWDGDTLVGTGAVSYFQVMPTVHNSTGQKAYIMNMYTAPQYRRQGVAAHTLALLVEDAHRRGTSGTVRRQRGLSPLGEVCLFLLTVKSPKRDIWRRIEEGLFVNILK